MKVDEICTHVSAGCLQQNKLQVGNKIMNLADGMQRQESHAVVVNLRKIYSFFLLRDGEHINFLRFEAEQKDQDTHWPQLTR